MKVIPILYMLLIGAISMNAQSSLNGIWDTGKENTKIEIMSENGIYIGKI